jgi:arylformamidase
MRVHDVTVTIRPGMAIWPGDPAVERSLVAEIGPLSAANVSQLSLSVHTGTHVDSPVHFITGAPGVESLPADILVGPCSLREIHPRAQHIDAADLEALRLPAGTQRLLVKTGNSSLWLRPSVFEPSFTAFTHDAARWIVEQGIRLIGIDYLSVEPSDNPEPVVHRTLLAAGVIPVEGLDLSKVSPGEYLLACLPLKIESSDGAPSRAVLIEL